MPLPSQSYEHAEAFMLMTYVADQDPAVFMQFWNSRDGVTPFVATLPGSGLVATHADWTTDVRAVNHKPKAGDWIFVDLTLDRARELAMKAAVRMWNMPENNDFHPSRRYQDVDALASVLIRDYERDARQGFPDLIQVQEDWA